MSSAAACSVTMVIVSIMLSINTRAVSPSSIKPFSASPPQKENVRTHPLILPNYSHNGSSLPCASSSSTSSPSASCPSPGCTPPKSCPSAPATRASPWESVPTGSQTSSSSTSPLAPSPTSDTAFTSFGRFSMPVSYPLLGCSILRLRGGVWRIWMRFS